MANVTKSNLFSESRNNVVTLITNNVSDPVISSSEFRKWIYSREPDMKSSDFKGYPLIIVHSTDVDIGDNGTVDGKSKIVNWDVEVEILTSDRGYGLKDGQGLSHMESITDSLFSVFLDITNRNTLSDQSMHFSKPTTSSINIEEIHNELIYRRSILLSFKSKIQVSS